MGPEKYVYHQQRLVRMNLFLSTLVQLYILHHSVISICMKGSVNNKIYFLHGRTLSGRCSVVTDPVARKKFLKNHNLCFRCLKKFTLAETLKGKERVSIVKASTIRIFLLKKLKIIQMKTQIMKPLQILYLSFHCAFTNR